MKLKQKKPNNLRLLRLLHDDEIPQKWVAYKIEIGQSAYCKMERGELKPSKKVIEKLSNFFEIDINEILYLPKEELKKRLIAEPIDIEYKRINSLEIEFDKLKRKLDVLKHKRSN